MLTAGFSKRSLGKEVVQPGEPDIHESQFIGLFYRVIVNKAHFPKSLTSGIIKLPECDTITTKN